jgi:hypothetical protein
METEDSSEFVRIRGSLASHLSLDLASTVAALNPHVLSHPLRDFS